MTLIARSTILECQQSMTFVPCLEHHAIVSRVFEAVALPKKKSKSGYCLTLVNTPRQH